MQRFARFCNAPTTLYVAGMEIVLEGGAEDHRTVYYSMGGAFRVIGGEDEGLYFRHGDHLGSTSVLSDGNGLKVESSDVVFAPFGEVRIGALTDLTDAGFTGQTHDGSTGGLMYYRSCYYLPQLKRFISPDTIVPGMANPQAFNRYSYVINNPLKYTDPTGYYFIMDEAERNFLNRSHQAAHPRSRSRDVITSDMIGRAVTDWPLFGKGEDASGGYIDPSHGPHMWVIDPANYGSPTIDDLRLVYEDWVRSNPAYNIFAGLDPFEAAIQRVREPHTQELYPCCQPHPPSLAQWAAYHGYTLNATSSRILSGPPGYERPSYFWEDLGILGNGFVTGTGDAGAPGGSNEEPGLVQGQPADPASSSLAGGLALLGGLLQGAQAVQNEYEPHPDLDYPGLIDMPYCWYTGKCADADFHVDYANGVIVPEPGPPGPGGDGD